MLDTVHVQLRCAILGGESVSESVRSGGRDSKVGDRQPALHQTIVERSRQRLLERIYEYECAPFTLVTCESATALCSAGYNSSSLQMHTKRAYGMPEITDSHIISANTCSNSRQCWSPQGSIAREEQQNIAHGLLQN